MSFIARLSHIAQRALTLSGISAAFFVFALTSSEPTRADTVYENAQSSTGIQWSLFSGQSSNGKVQSTYDNTINSEVIEFYGFKLPLETAYVLGGNDLGHGWQNKNEHFVSWRMKTSSDYIINFRLQTKHGLRYVRYRNTTESSKLEGNTVDRGLNPSTSDGSWATIKRDLSRDLLAGDPDNTLIYVDAMIVKGNMRLDDLKLSDSLEFNSDATVVARIPNSNSNDVPSESGNEDDNNPSVVLLTPKANSSLNLNNVVIAGSSEDDTGVSYLEIQIRDIDRTSDKNYLQGDGSWGAAFWHKALPDNSGANFTKFVWTAPLNDQSGKFTVNVRAVDTMGNTGSSTANITFTVNGAANTAIASAGPTTTTSSPPPEETTTANNNTSSTISVSSVPLAERRFVDANNGSNGNDGTFNNPWRTLQYAFAKISKGQTLFIRKGTYNEVYLELSNKGSLSEPITVVNYPGEKVTVDASRVEFRNGSNSWELIDNSLKLYQSKLSNYGNELYSGKASTSTGEDFILVTYQNDSANLARGYSDLTSVNYEVSTGSRYIGPGIYNKNGRLFVRLQQLPSSAVWGRKLPFPQTNNPNNVDIHVSDLGSVIKVSGTYTKIQGITIKGAKTGVDITSSANNINISDTTFSIAGSAVVLRDEAKNIVIDNNTFEGDFPPWVAWTDMKGYGNFSRAGSYWTLRASGVNGQFVNNLTVANNTFKNMFDGMVLSGANMDIYSNSGYFIDDFTQLGSDSDNVRIFKNRITGAGPSHYGRGNSSKPGTIYVYENVIDARGRRLLGKPDPQSLIPEEEQGWRTPIPFTAHDKSSLKAGDPWKIYHNTIVFNGSDNTHGTGTQLWAQHNKTGVKHEVLNNVFLDAGGGIVVTNISLDGGAQVYDGNVYWRTSNKTDWPIIAALLDDGKRSNYDTLAEFRESADFKNSKSLYSPGWEANGIDGPASINSDFSPKASGPAASGAVSLPSSFPGTRHTYRGALAPR